MAEFHEDYAGKPDVTIALTKKLYLGLIMEQVTFNEATQEGLITVKGDEALVPRFFASFDKPTNVPILTVR